MKDNAFPAKKGSHAGSLDDTLLAGGHFLKLLGVEVYEVGGMGAQFYTRSCCYIAHIACGLRAHPHPLHKLHFHAAHLQLVDALDSRLRGSLSGRMWDAGGA